MVPPLELEKSPLDFLSHTCAALSGDSDTLIHSEDESSPEWLWLRLINASPSPVGRTDFAPMLIQQLCDALTGKALGFYRVRIHGGSVYFTCDTTRGESVPRRAAANGVRVIMVDPSYTSQRCNRCGYVDAGNRNGARFDCKRCAWSDNADHNAAMNIRDRAIASLEHENTSTDRPVDRVPSTTRMDGTPTMTSPSEDGAESWGPRSRPNR